MRKTIVIVILMVAVSSAVYGQSVFDSNLARANVSTIDRSLLPAFQAFPDSTILNSIGALFNDDPRYNMRAPIWIPATKILLSNAVLLGMDRYIFNYDFSHVSFKSWQHNIDTGWVWDDDRFGENFFLHPYTGAGYFMDARSLGYNYWESIPFAVFGSVMWEYFGETTPPSKNDVVNTPINGTFLGEVGYRITSNILDDSKTGSDRVWREIVVGLISPSRFFSRLIQGKLWATAPGPVYEQEPMDVRLSIGPHIVNNGTDIGSGPTKFSANLMLEYGNPFDRETHDPFDHFKVWGDISNAYGRKYLDNVTGYGLLWGSNVQIGKLQTLMGLFQHFDYWDNNTFELGDVAIGGGIISKLPITDYHSLYSNWHLSFIPMAGNNTTFGPIDTTQTRDYNFGDGIQAMTETGFSLGKKLVDLSLVAYYIYFHSYYGQPGDNSIVLLRPRIALNLFEHLGLAFEHQIYISDRTSPTLQGVNLKRTEQKIVVQWNWDDFPKE
jgi:hypothetical protein